MSQLALHVTVISRNLAELLVEQTQASLLDDDGLVISVTFSDSRPTTKYTNKHLRPANPQAFDQLTTDAQVSQSRSEEPGPDEQIGSANS